jgi:hypothetical protein
VYLESSGIFFALVTLGAVVCVLPAGFGIGMLILVPAAAIGLITPVMASRAYGARFPVAAARWKSRRRVGAVGTALNLVVALVALALLRWARVR